MIKIRIVEEVLNTVPSNITPLSIKILYLHNDELDGSKFM